MKLLLVRCLNRDHNLLTINRAALVSQTAQCSVCVCMFEPVCVSVCVCLNLCVCLCVCV